MGIPEVLQGRKILYLDIETTGVEVDCDILQIAGIIEIDGEVREQFDFYAKPLDMSKIRDEALQVSGVTREQIETFPSAQEVHDKLVAIFSRYINKYDKSDKFTPAGFNVKFDVERMWGWFDRMGDKYWGSWCNWRFLDALSIVYFWRILGIVPELTNYKLETVATYFGFDFKGMAHDAMADITITRKLIHKILLAI